jgi:hypothetical protein
VSYIDNNRGLRQFDRALIDRDLLTSFEEVLNIQINGLADIRQRLRIGMPPCMTTFEGWTEGMPRIAPILEFVRLNRNLKMYDFMKTSPWRNDLHGLSHGKQLCGL